MNEADLAHYKRLAEGSHYTGKELWYILHSRRRPTAGRLCRASSVRLVESASVPGLVHQVDLESARCSCRGFRFRNCPHVPAMLKAETKRHRDKVAAATPAMTGRERPLMEQRTP